jgi:RNA polymerase sigma factor (sigma-70 family)
LTGDREVAQDLLQQTFLRMGQHWEAASRAPAAYAHRVLVNLLHDRRRGLRRRVSESPLSALPDHASLATDEMASAVDRIVLLDAVRTLPARQREVLVLRFYADLSVADTAAAIGTSEGSVKAHTSRALAALHRALAKAPASNLNDTDRRDRAQR